MGFLAIRFIDNKPDEHQTKMLEGFDRSAGGTYSIGEPTPEDLRNSQPEWPTWSTAQLQEDWQYDAGARGELS